MLLTASLLVAVVGTVIVPVTHLTQSDAVAVITSKLSGWAGGCWCVAPVLQLIRLIAAVVVTITHKVMRNAAAILTGELVLLAGLVGTALFITAVTAVVTAIAPDCHKKYQRLSDSV